MTDEKIEEINQSAMSLHSWIHPDHELRPYIKHHAELVAKRYVAAEVDRLLECWAGNSMTPIAQIKVWTNSDGTGFNWAKNLSGRIEAEGTDKQSLLEYIGFSQ